MRPCFCAHRRRNWPGATAVAMIALAVLAGAAPPVRAQHDEEPASRYFRIGTAASGGTYFPIGGLIASAISSPPGARPCEEGGSCGVPGLIAVAEATQGSVENIRLIGAGRLEAGLCQADVAEAAFRGLGAFAKAPQPRLRAIATLFRESLHLVVRADSPITEIAQLKQKRVSLGEEASGTEVDAEAVLAASHLRLRDVTALFLSPGEASDALRAGSIDAFFLVAGAPVSTIVELAETTPIRLLPIHGPAMEALHKAHAFLLASSIPAGLYHGVGATETVGVGAELVVAAELDEALAHDVTKALWNDGTHKLLMGGHPEGARIRLEHALDGLAIPLHPGAERYYREIGLIH
jgi:TRAP transporter TAXI family solute receptor